MILRSGRAHLREISEAAPRPEHRWKDLVERSRTESSLWQSHTDLLSRSRRRDLARAIWSQEGSHSIVHDRSGWRTCRYSALRHSVLSIPNVTLHCKKMTFSRENRIFSSAARRSTHHHIFVIAHFTINFALALKTNLRQAITRFQGWVKILGPRRRWRRDPNRYCDGQTTALWPFHTHHSGLPVTRTGENQFQALRHATHVPCTQNTLVHIINAGRL